MLGAHPPGLGESGLRAAAREVLDAHLPHGARAGLAVSGGADSVALAHLAARARPDLAWVVVHVRHGLRDDAADARAAAACAAAIGAAYDERPVDVWLRPRTGVEAAAREARHQALRDAAAARSLAAVCLGHTADDRAETVLLNLGRGAGLRGVGALGTWSGDAPRLLRPLVRLRRDDVRGWARGADLVWVEDPTNADPDQRRARARTEVLPALGRLSGGTGDPVGVLCRLADLAAADADALDATAEASAARHVVAWGPVRAVRAEVLEGLPVAVARRVVRTLLATVRGGLAGLSAGDVEAVRTLAPGRAHTVSGGVLASCGRGWVAAAPATSAALAPRVLAAPGSATVPEAGVRVVADRLVDAPADPRVPPRAPAASGPTWTRLAAGPLRVRGPAAGDRVRTDRGDVPLADLVAGAGIPRPVRPLLPVVVDGDDRVRFVPGVVATAADERGDAPALRLWLAPLTGCE